MRRHALLAAAVCASLGQPSSCAWPWESSRYFSDVGDADDDVSFAGLPQGSGFKTDGLTSCGCDLTANACDAFCCCDAACSSFERATLFDCADEAAISARPGVSTCVDASAVVSANLPDTSKAAWEADGDDPLARVLCVAADNSASYGNFITPMEPLSSSELEGLSAPNSSFASALRAGGADTPRESYYVAGQPLNKGTGSGEGASADQYAPLLLPNARVGGGACVDSGPVRFLEAIAPSSCVTYAPAGSTLGALCVPGSTLDPAAYAGVRIGNSGLRPGSSSYSTVSLSITSITAIPLGTDQRTALSTSDVPTVSVDNSTDVCLNVLTGAILRLTYNDEGELTAAQAYLTVSDLPMSAASVQRSFGQAWEPDGAKDSRPRSGRPGYLRGLPVLTGRADDEDGGPVRPSTAGLVGLIWQQRDGLCAPKPSLPAMPAAGGGGLVAEGINFGEDALLSCELGYDLATLKAKCEAEEQYTLSNLTDSYIGRFGDSYGSLASDWVELVKGTAGDPSWDDDTQTCSGMVLGLAYEFFHAKYGAAVDLQQQIVGARLSFRTGAWRFASSPRQLFTVSASFIEVPTGAAAQFIPPAPGLFAPLPDDVFYPFSVSPQSIAGSVSGRR